MRTMLSLILVVLFLPSGLLLIPSSHAASAREIEARVDDSLDVFRKEVRGGKELLSKARGVLVLPKVYKAGIGLGGEYGEGALQVRGKTVNYYNMVAASYGFQLGAQKKTIVLLFMEPAALEQFQMSNGWKVGVDASVALIKVGAEGNIDSKTLNQPILGFVIDQKGLMYDLSLEGAKFSKIDKK